MVLSREMCPNLDASLSREGSDITSHAASTPQAEAPGFPLRIPGGWSRVRAGPVPASPNAGPGHLEDHGEAITTGRRAPTHTDGHRRARAVLSRCHPRQVLDAHRRGRQAPGKKCLGTV